MFGEKTDDDIKFERAVALRAIASRADQLRNSGAQPFEIQSFINGARGELAREAPDPDMYRRALRAAALQRMTRGEEGSDDRTGFGSFASGGREMPGSPLVDPGGPPTDYTVPSKKMRGQTAYGSESGGSFASGGRERPGSPFVDPGGPPTDYKVPSTKEEWARLSAGGPIAPANATQEERDIAAAWRAPSQEEIKQIWQKMGAGNIAGRSGGGGGRGGRGGGRGREGNMGGEMQGRGRRR